MLGSKPVSTPFVVGTSPTTKDGTTLVNAIMYHQVVGGLQTSSDDSAGYYLCCE